MVADEQESRGYAYLIFGYLDSLINQISWLSFVGAEAEAKTGARWERKNTKPTIMDVALPATRRDV